MNTAPDWNQITARWNQAMNSESAMAWRAITHWMAAEALINEVDGMHDIAASMCTLSDLAHQHYVDLMPRREMEEAA